MTIRRIPETADIWLITDSEELRRRVTETLERAGGPEPDNLACFGSSGLDAGELARGCARLPALAILDVDGDLDRGLKVIREFRMARMTAPLVVITNTFSRDFGAKIISEGVRYFFGHDYCEEEFAAVIQSSLQRAAD